MIIIIGESGSGKSTTKNMITRLLDSTEGSIVLDGTDITHLGGKELRKVYSKMQMVFQTPTESFDPRCTLGDGIGESLRNSGMSRSETRTEVKKLLKQCGLPEEFANRYPHQVSGGQCQRAAIARALAIELQQTILDDNAYVFCSFLRMNMISKSNVSNWTAHACDYYEVTVDLDIA